MNQSLPSQRSRCFLFLTLSVITSLILLINVSFKIIAIQGLMFSVIGLIGPLVTGLYLLALRNCTIKEQRHLLNISLITLYVFCIGVYVLINLPPAEYMHNNSVYQIIFEDLPKNSLQPPLHLPLVFTFLIYLPIPNPVKDCLHQNSACSLRSWEGFFSLA